MDPLALLELSKAAKSLALAISASRKAAQIRSEIPIGSSRAKVTTANARWATIAEDRDRKREQFVALIRELVQSGAIRISELQ